MLSAMNHGKFQKASRVSDSSMGSFLCPVFPSINVFHSRKPCIFLQFCLANN